jgi:hypothetical protein
VGYSKMADEMEYEDCVLKVNKTYAANFKKKSEKAELDRCKCIVNYMYVELKAAISLNCTRKWENFKIGNYNKFDNDLIMIVEINFHKYLQRLIDERFVIAPLSLEDFLWISWNINYRISPIVSISTITASAILYCQQ